MKIILFSDGHGTMTNPVGRKDDIGKAFFQKLNFIFRLAKRKHAIIVTAGDIGDKPREWYFLSKLGMFLKTRKHVKMFTVYGQHDAYLYNEETKHATTLGVLARLKALTILNSVPFRPDPSVAIYGCSWGMEVPVAVDEPRHAGGSVFNLLSIHTDVSNEPLWPGHQYTKAKTFLRRNDSFDGIICGDIHRKFFEHINGRFIANTGPLLRSEANKYNFTHIPSVLLLDTDTTEFEAINVPHQPVDDVLSREHIEIQTETARILDDFVNNIEHTNVEEEGEINTTVNLVRFMEQNEVEQDVRTEIEEIISATANRRP